MIIRANIYPSTGKVLCNGVIESEILTTVSLTFLLQFDVLNIYYLDSFGREEKFEVF